jgi:hypothetical protein
VLGLSAALLAVLALQTAAAPSSKAPDATAVQAARAIGQIRIDGVLDEPDWARARPARTFTQLDPDEGRPASERTEVRVLIDGDALYFGALLGDSDPSGIVSRLARRDADNVESDWFEVALDAYHDHLTALEFAVTPAGSIRDGTIGADGSTDRSWDPVWESATSIDSRGWTVEIRIPLSQLRYTSQANAVWGVQFTRRILRKQETALFAFIPKSESAGVNRFGHLVGLGTVRAPRRLELLPYTLTRAEYTSVAAGNPFRDGRDVFGGAGFELKYGLTTALTLDTTMRPDFGQVELDPSVVNLTDFEVRFDERRPFFIEGADQFRFARYRASGGAEFPQLFFSRRIGRPPARSLSSSRYPYADVPNQTTILGAAKLSGKPAGWSVGVLNAVTADEHAPYLDVLGGRREAPVEPMSNYFVARLSRELRNGDTALGTIVTAVHRDLDDEALGAQLRSSAYVFGADLSHNWNNRTWVFDGALIGSAINGTPEAITLAQRASARYFHRPDAPHLTLDPTRTTLAGHAAQVGLTRLAGVHWRGSIGYQQVSPGFEANDVGFQRFADFRHLALRLEYRENQPGQTARSWQILGLGRRGWDFGGNVVTDSLGLYGRVQFHNFWSAYAQIDRDFETYDARLTRGGPLSVAPARLGYSLGLSTDDRNSYQADSGWSYYRDRSGARTWSTYLSVGVTPTPSARLSVGPSYSSAFATAQYAARIADPTATATFGQRYIFAALDQMTFAVPMRVDWSLTPRLSIQLFTQPFVGTGSFFDYAELRGPRVFRFDVYGRDRGTIAREPGGGLTIDPDGQAGSAPSFTLDDFDFDFRTTRTSLVLRWEYRPGSTLFVAWQRRSSQESAVVVKATYWIGL